MVIPKPGDQCGCACGQTGSVSEIRRRAIEAGANKNFARSTVFVPYAGTSFSLNWYLENQTKATRGASCDHEHVVLHIARIDRSYVIASPCRSRSRPRPRLQRAISITDATELALRRLDR